MPRVPKILDGIVEALPRHSLRCTHRICNLDDLFSGNGKVVVDVEQSNRARGKRQGAAAISRWYVLH